MTMANVKEGDTSITTSGRTTQLEGPVLEALEIDRLLLLMLDHYDLASDNPNKGRNIIAVDKDGNEAWRIQPFWHKVKARDGSMVPDPYDGLRIDKNGKLIAFQGIGYRCELDPKTGEIINAEYTR